ncbi:MAG TPA: cupin domain-containing protein [Thermomicrobiales bacterium]|nr:cupin domain-containing protein [Thermomicrobiales bacterium]
MAPDGEREGTGTPREGSAGSGGRWARHDALPVVEPQPGITIRSVVGDKLHVAWIRIAPETALPIHRHPHEQIGVVLEGAIEVTIGGETRRVGPGDAYAVPGGVEHGGRTGEDGVLVLETFTPVRQEYLVPDEG